MHDGFVLGVGCSLSCFLDGCWHFHFSLEVHFGLLVALLSVLQLLIPSIDEVVARSDVVVPVVFDAFLGVLTVEVEFLDDVTLVFRGDVTVLR